MKEGDLLPFSRLARFPPSGNPSLHPAGFEERTPTAHVAEASLPLARKRRLHQTHENVSPILPAGHLVPVPLRS